MPITALSVTPLLQVFDMKASVAFYTNILGFTLLKSHPASDAGPLHWAMLKLGGAVIMLNSKYEEENQPLAPDPQSASHHADTELYFHCPDLDQAHAHLTAKGLSIRPPKVAYYGMRQLHLTDLDGYQLCFQHPV